MRGRALVKLAAVLLALQPSRCAALEDGLASTPVLGFNTWWAPIRCHLQAMAGLARHSHLISAPLRLQELLWAQE